MQPKPRRRHKLSAIVVSYNREEMIGTVLRGLQFADEVILLDKSSTDRTVEIGGAFADRVVRVPSRLFNALSLAGLSPICNI